VIGQIGALFLPLFAIVFCFLAQIIQGARIDWTLNIGSIIATLSFVIAGLVTLKLQPIRMATMEKAIAEIQKSTAAHEKWSKEQTLQFAEAITRLTAMQEAMNGRTDRIEKWIDNGQHRRAAGAGGD